MKEYTKYYVSVAVQTTVFETVLAANSKDAALKACKRVRNKGNRVRMATVREAWDLGKSDMSVLDGETFEYVEGVKKLE